MKTKQTPMSFQSDKAFNRLKTHGKVYTFRAMNRRVGPCWINRHRGGTKIFNAFVTEVGLKHLDELGPYVLESGFESLDAWHAEIKRMNPNRFIRYGFLYLVKKEQLK